jgi:DedD protein
MEVKGDEFLKNLEIEKEKAELEKRRSELNSQKFQSVYQQANSPLNSISPDMDTDYQELDDIILNKNANNKQKYIVFGFALVLLFLITILTIRLVSEPQSNNNFTGDEKILEEEPKEIVVQEKTPTNKNVNKSLDINKIIQSEDNINIKTEEKTPLKEESDNDGDVFGIEKVTTTKASSDIVIKKDETVKKEEKAKQIVIESVPVKEIKIEETKPASKPVVKKQEAKVSAVKGYYIQVGAFTKYPDKKLLSKLKINGYRVTMHKMEIKGKMYTKVLIGSYKSKAEANSNLPYIKQRINKSAYILRF